MKKVYQLIATFTLSLLAIGVSAQQMAPAGVSKVEKQIVKGNMPSIARHQHKATNYNVYAFLDYPFNDSIIASGYSLSYSGSPGIGRPGYIQDFNMRYNLSDTGSPGPTAGSGSFNNTLLHSYSVVFDTLLNATTDSGYSYQQSSTTTVDSLFIPIGQQNVSGKNDTIVVQINGVSAGSPNATVLWSQTIIQDTGLSGKGKSWFYGYELMLNPNLAVTGPFAVTVQYFSPNKRDSCGFLYGFPQSLCSGNNIPDTTFIGAPINADKLNATFTAIAGTHPIIANSFLSGWQYLTGYPYKATNKAITMPSAPTYPTNNYLGGDDYFGYQCTSGSTTIVSSNGYQDIALYALVSMTITGVDNISGNGLNVGQNYPNPANGSTEIKYSVTKSSDVVFTVADMMGRKLVDNTYSGVAPGQHVISLSANQFAPGVYFYTFNVNGKSVTKKMVITE